MKIHPACNLFPATTGATLVQLRASIKEHGQQQPIVFDDDELLDGRTRLKICEELRIRPKKVQFKDLNVSVSPAQWIMDINYHRRNLTNDQRLAIYTKFQKLEEQKEREEEDREVSGRKQPKTGPRGGRPSNGGREREKIAKATGQSQHRAKLMVKLAKANPELATEVEEGRMNLKEAIKQAGLSKARRPKPPRPAAEDSSREEQTADNLPTDTVLMTQESVIALGKGLPAHIAKWLNQAWAFCADDAIKFEVMRTTAEVVRAWEGELEAKSARQAKQMQYSEEAPEPEEPAPEPVEPEILEPEPDLPPPRRAKKP